MNQDHTQNNMDRPDSDTSTALEEGQTTNANTESEGAAKKNDKKKEDKSEFEDF